MKMKLKYQIRGFAIGVILTSILISAFNGNDNDKVAEEEAEAEIQTEFINE